MPAAESCKNLRRGIEAIVSSYWVIAGLLARW
jgi:hypothetical protein